MTVLYTENDGGKLAVEVLGDEAGPLVVCSPGLGDMRDAYYPLAEVLVGAGYRVAILDLRGQGDSSAIFASYGDEATAQDLIKVTESLLLAGSNHRVVFIGASMSAAAAAIAAGRRPELVAGIATMGGFLRSPPLARLMLGLLNVLLWRPWGPAVWRMYAAGLWPGLGAEGAKARAQVTGARLQSAPGRWAAFQALAGSIDHDEVKPFLEHLKTVPALVVVGDKDPDWSKPVEEAAWVAGNFAADATTTLVVPGAGHAPMLENPALVGPEVLRFVNSLRKGNTF